MKTGGRGRDDEQRTMKVEEDLGRA